MVASRAGCHRGSRRQTRLKGPQQPHVSWRALESAGIDFHPTWVFTIGAGMTDLGRGGAVVVVKPRYTSRGLCTCGWVERPRLLLSSAIIDALVHAARHGCVPAIPLIQIGVVMTMERSAILDDCPRGTVANRLSLTNDQAAAGHHVSSNRRGRRPVFHRQPYSQLTIGNVSANTIDCGKTTVSFSIGLLSCRVYTVARLFGKSRIAT
jgi:hypothetical protein